MLDHVKKEKHNIDSPKVKPADISLALSQKWQHPAPTGLSRTTVPMWMKRDEGGLPILPSTFCPSILDASREIKCRAKDLYGGTMTTMERLPPGHEIESSQRGHLMVRAQDLPRL